MEPEKNNAKLIRQLIIIALLVLVGMSLYETLKQFIFPDISIWESHMITIVFSTLCAAVSSFFILRNHIELNSRLTEKNLESEILQRELENTVKKLEITLSEVKTLSGMLPICASCKKIRDDKGYWNLLEAYIENHSQAFFSHSMCPECTEKFYGGQNWYIKMKK